MKRKILQSICVISFVLFVFIINVQNNSDITAVADDQKEENYSKVDAAYGFCVNGDSGIINYEGDEIKFTANFENGPVDCELGIVIFVNGIPQKYYTDDIKEAKYIVPYNISAYTKKDIEIYFKPVAGRQDEMLNIYVGSMLNPSVSPDNVNFSFGNNHNVFFQKPMSLQCLETADVPQASEHYITKKISPDIQQNYIYQDDGGNPVNLLDSNVVAEIKVNHNTTNKIQMKEQRLNCEVDLYGGEDMEYILSAYVNSELVPVFDGNLYSRLQTRKGNISSVSIDFDMSGYDLSKYNTFYIMAVPVKGNGNACKLSSCILINEK